MYVKVSNYVLLNLGMLCGKHYPSFRLNYRVFNNEGQKVLGYETMKKCAFEATKRLIASKNMGHFDIQSSFIKRLA